MVFNVIVTNFLHTNSTTWAFGPYTITPNTKGAGWSAHLNGEWVADTHTLFEMRKHLGWRAGR